MKLADADRLIRVGVDAISGAEIKALEKCYKSLLAEGWISSSADSAIQSICNCFGEIPSRSGSNIAGIVAIREKIHELCCCSEDANGLAIYAPHTHWGCSPIIISFATDGYAVGPGPIDESTIYRPVSFLLHEDGPIPYEWCDSSVYLDDENLSLMYSVVHGLSSSLGANRWPLGVSVHFKFKPICSAIKIVTSEAVVQDGDVEMTYIQSADMFIDEILGDDVGQVGWHALSDKWLLLDRSQENVLRKTRSIIEKIKDSSSRREVLEAVRKMVQS
ncbi:hypothetical protein M2318_005279 [Metapseudomonas resinovorans]|uniref:hypothetical protein n=1 Tax=Metapseudomonas resinovorans TaxID=53412 RepID=UPI003D195C92